MKTQSTCWISRDANTGDSAAAGLLALGQGFGRETGICPMLWFLPLLSASSSFALTPSGAKDEEAEGKETRGRTPPRRGSGISPMIAPLLLVR